MREATLQRLPRVTYWTNIPTPYVQDRFNAIAERGSLNFQAWFMAERESDRSWVLQPEEWRFRYRYLRGIGSRDHRFTIPLDLLTAPPDVLVSLYAQTAFVLGRAVTRSRRTRHAFYVEKTFDEWVPRHAWKERLKKQLFTKADGVMVSGRDAADYALGYGAPLDRLHELGNATDVSYYASRSQISATERVAARREFGFEGITFLFMGRIWEGKGLQYLLEAYEIVRRESSQTATLAFVGDGKHEARFRQYCAEKPLTNVRFLGFRQRAETPRIYAASDVFVFPTLGDTYGMAIDEAMACGLPVIASESCGEIKDRVVDGVTGFLVPPRDPPALADRMLRLAGAQDLRERMGAAAKVKIMPRTPEGWALQFDLPWNEF